MLEQGRRWTAKACLEKADDVFFLLYPEFEEAVASGKLDGATAKESVRRRRRQWADVQDYVLPDNFTGLPEIRRVGEAPAPTSTLTGLGVSPGVATGPARVIASFSDGTAADFKPGEILVAPYTDAPWTPLFATAAGVVVETGGVLSHAATVAREYGIPAVAMIKDATRMIETGQQITVNGGAGQVLLG
jgi:pyruvate,water dikinase